MCVCHSLYSHMKRHGMDASLEPPEGTKLLWYPDFHSGSFISDAAFQKCKRINLCWIKSLSFVIIYCSNNSKLIQLKTNDVRHLFHMLICLYIFFGETSVQIICPFITLGYLFSYCWFLNVLSISYIQVSYQTYIFQIFSPTLWLVYKFHKHYLL